MRPAHSPSQAELSLSLQCLHFGPATAGFQTLYSLEARFPTRVFWPVAGTRAGAAEQCPSTLVHSSLQAIFR